MHYVSTRGQCAPLPFRETVMAGLAPDGGLFLPERVPDVSARLADWRELPFRELFAAVVAPYVGDELAPGLLADLVERAYATFDHAEVTPVVPVGDVFVCELFHGPTLAFKDVALQFLGHLFEHFLALCEARLTVLGATSGDTGSAAIHALRGRHGIEVFILYPRGRVSPMQEKQMVTVPDANIHCIAVEGSFDDAQALVKGLFNDRAFNDEVSLGAVNSINWARVMAQITYFFYAYFRVLDACERGSAQGGPMALGDAVRFAVPTGNFGHIYAGVLARRMGLPIERLVLATNANAILSQLVRTGRYAKGDVQQTLSPSMDIQVASNFERYLFDLAGGDGGQVRRWLAELSEQGGFALDAAQLAQVQQDFTALEVSDAETVGTIRAVHEATGYLLDPHSAIGYRAAQAHRQAGQPVIAMATAHPAKFSGAIQRAIGHEPPLPSALALLADLPARVKVLPAEMDGLRGYIRETLQAATPVPR
ncbi:MAG TPA: threonine synthase [bacterium]|nr:threonine synthase [bacterium]